MNDTSTTPPRRHLSIEPDRDRSAKVRCTFNLPRELMEEARDTVVALAGPPHRLTLAKLVQNALRLELDRLRSERSGSGRGQPFPERGEGVRTGRPIT